MTLDAIDHAEVEGEQVHGGHYRYPGAPPFRDDDLDRRLFQGRAIEADTVLHSILSSHLFLLYAESGLGKTSLLNAGVLHKLRERGHWPVSVRMNDTARPPVHGIRNQIIEAAASDPTVELHIDTPGLADDATLWDLLASIEVWRGNDLPQLVLILDQFEELFTLGWSATTRDKFISEFGEVVRRHRGGSDGGLPPPAVRFVLVIREDSIGSLEALAADVPNIMRNRLRLGPLDPVQAESAIRAPANVEDARLFSQRFEYTESAAAEILDFLRTNSAHDATTLAGGVDPSQLQIVCQYVERAILPGKAAAAPADTVVQIDGSDLGGRAGLDLILSHFYRRTVDALPAAHQRPVRQLCETGLINPNGRRLSLELESIDAEFGVTPAMLQALVDARLLRAEPRVGSVYYELAHDTLVAAILADRAERNAQRTRRRRRLAAAAAVLLIVAFGVVSMVSAFRTSPAAPEVTVPATATATPLELGTAQTAELVQETAMFTVDDPDSGVIAVRVDNGDLLDLAIEVTDQTGRSVSTDLDRSAGSATVVMAAPAPDVPATYEVTVSSRTSTGGSFGILAEPRDPVALAPIPTDDEVTAGEAVVFDVDITDHPQIIDIEPLGDAQLDATIELISDAEVVRESIDVRRGAKPERVLLADPGRFYVVVRGVDGSSGAFRIAATPTEPISPETKQLGDGGGVSYFAVPGDGGVRAVLVSPFDDDFDIEIEIFRDGEPPVAPTDFDPGRQVLGFLDDRPGDQFVAVSAAASQSGSFRIEVSDSSVDVTGSDALSGLQAFTVDNVDERLLEFVAEPIDAEQELQLRAFDGRLFPLAVAATSSLGGTKSLIFDEDVSGRSTVVVYAQTPSPVEFRARLQALENPVPDGEPVAANGSRPFFLTVEPGEQLEFAALADPDSGPTLDVSVTGEDRSGPVINLQPGSSVAVILGCSVSSEPQKVEVNVEASAFAGRTTVYRVQVRKNPSTDGTIEWCGEVRRPTGIIAPTLYSLLTNSGAAPEIADCTIQSLADAIDTEGGVEVVSFDPNQPTQAFEAELTLLAAFYVASIDEDEAVGRRLIEDLVTTIGDIAKKECGLSQVAIDGVSDRSYELLAGGSVTS